jgi:hypothetical protein
VNAPACRQVQPGEQILTAYAVLFLFETFYDSIHYMLTDQDIQKLKDVFASRDELVSIFGTREELVQVQKEMVDLKTAVHVLIDSVDKLTKSMEGLKIEYLAIAEKLKRHERWIQQVAQKTGVQLDD